MIEKDFWQDAFIPKDSQEALLEHGSTPDFLRENGRTQAELMGLKSEISWESKEKEVVSPITREDIDSLTRRNSLD